MVNSASFKFSIVQIAANITDSRLKGEKAATKPAFWMKITLILSTAQVPPHSFGLCVLCAWKSPAIVVVGSRSALRSDTIWSWDDVDIAMVVLRLPYFSFFFFVWPSCFCLSLCVSTVRGCECERNRVRGAGFTGTSAFPCRFYCRFFLLCAVLPLLSVTIRCCQTGA